MESCQRLLNLLPASKQNLLSFGKLLGLLDQDAKGFWWQRGMYMVVVHWLVYVSFVERVAPHRNSVVGYALMVIHGCLCALMWALVRRSQND